MRFEPRLLSSRVHAFNQQAYYLSNIQYSEVPIYATFCYYTRDFSELYVLNNVSITLSIVNFWRKIIRKKLAWLPYSDFSFNPASYNNSLSNIYSVPPLYHTKCFVFINLFIPHGPYEVCMIVSPILLMSKLKLMGDMQFACGHISSEHPRSSLQHQC